MGRPKGPPIKIFSVRLLEETFKRLEKKAAAKKMTAVDYVRQLIDKDLAK